jgi:hypothetical protein
VVHDDEVAGATIAEMQVVQELGLELELKWVDKPGK